MEHSESIAAISAALAKAQGDIRNPPKNKEVTVRPKVGSPYKFKYATLDAIQEAIRKPLADAKVGVVQTVRGDQLVTRLMHNGEWIESSVPMPRLPDSPQQIGSTLTFMKRYGICAALGISADEDDDANTGEGNGITDKRDNRDQPKLPDEKITLLQGLADASQADLQKFCAHFKVPSLAAIRPDQFSDAEAALRKKLSQRQAKGNGAGAAH